MQVVGLMSGTSADGVDAALVRWPSDRSATLRGAFDEGGACELEAYCETPLGSLQERIHALAAGELAGERMLEELATLDRELGERFADAVIAVCERAGCALDEIAGVASHGQTVAHHPEHGSSIQIGSPAVIVARTGRPVVADFRRPDLALGGEGAPLAPFFHWAIFSRPGEASAVLNLGGIANLSLLPADGDADRVVAFDVGPANALLDGAVRAHSGGRQHYDRDGALAAAGAVDTGLLERLLDDDFLRRVPPKSTGRERYGRREADALFAEWAAAGRRFEDLAATLTAFTVEAVARALREFSTDPVARLVVGGGGAENPELMRRLATACAPCAVSPMDTAGVPAAAAEAMAFSLLGRNTLLGIPNHLPRTTGARTAAVLGAVWR